MNNQLCIKTEKKERKERLKEKVVLEIVEKVLKIAKEEIDIDSGIDGLEKGLTPILAMIRQKVTEKIETCIRYFENNISRMDYGAYKEKGFDVGSGTIESAHRVIVQSRMKQAGMHWGKKNVQSILSLRVKYLSGG